MYDYRTDRNADQYPSANFARVSIHHSQGDGECAEIVVKFSRKRKPETCVAINARSFKSSEVVVEHDFRCLRKNCGNTVLD